MASSSSRCGPHPRRPSGVVWSEAAADEVPKRVARACQHAFQLATELPLRCEVFALGPDEHMMVLLIHHIACDGWSLGPLTRDLTEAYRARRRPAIVARRWRSPSTEVIGPSDPPARHRTRRLS